jgi:hypothetical protein
MKEKNALRGTYRVRFVACFVAPQSLVKKVRISSVEMESRSLSE